MVPKCKSPMTSLSQGFGSSSGDAGGSLWEPGRVVFDGNKL